MQKRLPYGKRQTADKGLALSKYTKVLIDLFQKVVGF